MAALSADVIRNVAENLPLTIAYVIANGVQIYVGSFCDDVSGVAQPHTTGHTVFGIAQGPGVPGNDPNMDGFAVPPASAIAPGNNLSPPATRNQVVLDQGAFTLINVATIASAAGAQTDVNTLVYLSNDNDITTVQPGSDKPLGFISAWNPVGTTNYWNVFVYAYAARTTTN